MIKLALTAAFLMSAMISGAAAESLWEGTTTITKKSGGCSSSSFVQLRDYRSVLRPRISTSDDFKSSLTLLLDYAAARIARPGNNDFQWNGSGDYDAQFIGGRANFTTFGGTFKFKTTPKVISSATDIVKLTGTVQNFLAGGCTITVKGEYTFKPE
jgi:hypothetical protein